MFRTPGANRSHRQNVLLAGYLALVAGYVNAVGFVVLGVFTSHATGNVGRLAHELASRHGAAAGAALLLVGSFFGGAFAASVILESALARRRGTNAYGVALLVEALLLCFFAVAAADRGDLQAAILCVAMGMQNSLVTRLSGAVVRTTHLTGVVTDLGIEAARWLQWSRGARFAAAGTSIGPEEAVDRPSLPKVALLGTIAASFTTGAVLGSTIAAAVGRTAALAPSLALAAGAAYAFASRDTEGTIPPPRSR